MKNIPMTKFRLLLLALGIVGTLLLAVSACDGSNDASSATECMDNDGARPLCEPRNVSGIDLFSGDTAAALDSPVDILAIYALYQSR